MNNTDEGRTEPNSEKLGQKPDERTRVDEEPQNSANNGNIAQGTDTDTMNTNDKDNGDQETSDNTGESWPVAMDENSDRAGRGNVNTEEMETNQDSGGAKVDDNREQSMDTQEQVFYVIFHTKK